MEKRRNGRTMLAALSVVCMLMCLLVLAGCQNDTPKQKHTVSLYETSGAADPASTVEVSHGDTYTLPVVPGSTPSGKVFLGWSLVKDVDDDIKSVKVEKPLSFYASWASEPVAGSIFAGGDGTVNDPFRIKTVKQLEDFSAAVNCGEDYAGKYVALSNDIDLENKDWTPIGKENADSPTANGSSYNNKAENVFGFGGIFDGQNHTIKNLKVVKKNVNKADNKFCALFGIILPGTTLKNLTIENVELEGYLYIGAFVGEIVNADEIHNQSVLLENLKLTGEASVLVSLNGEGCVGGILGRSELKASALTIKNCTVDVSGSSKLGANSSGQYATFGGGIVGAAYGTEGTIMEGCSSNISVSGIVQGIGGLAGLFWNGTVTDCHVTASLIELTPYPDGSTYFYDRYCVGGFIGCTGKSPMQIEIDGISTCDTTVKASYKSTEPLYNGGLVGGIRATQEQGSYEGTDSANYVTIDQNFDYSGIVIENTYEPSVD